MPPRRLPTPPPSLSTVRRPFPCPSHEKLGLLRVSLPPVCPTKDPLECHPTVTPTQPLTTSQASQGHLHSVQFPTHSVPPQATQHGPLEPLSCTGSRPGPYDLRPLWGAGPDTETSVLHREPAWTSSSNCLFSFGSQLGSLVSSMRGALSLPPAPRHQDLPPQPPPPSTPWRAWKAGPRLSPAPPHPPTGPGRGEQGPTPALGRSRRRGAKAAGSAGLRRGPRGAGGTGGLMGGDGAEAMGPHRPEPWLWLRWPPSGPACRLSLPSPASLLQRHLRWSRHGLSPSRPAPGALPEHGPPCTPSAACPRQAPPAPATPCGA